jgi:hypothetical protein
MRRTLQSSAIDQIRLFRKTHSQKKKLAKCGFVTISNSRRNLDVSTASKRLQSDRKGATRLCSLPIVGGA